ncbi:MAG: hypothetical protein AAGA56_20060, partial [Myxococcota bacterium]
MDRRHFIKLASTAIAASSLPPSVAAAAPAKFQASLLSLKAPPPDVLSGKAMTDALAERLILVARGPAKSKLSLAMHAYAYRYREGQKLEPIGRAVAKAPISVTVQTPGYFATRDGRDFMDVDPLKWPSQIGLKPAGGDGLFFPETLFSPGTIFAPKKVNRFSQTHSLHAATAWKSLEALDEGPANFPQAWPSHNSWPSHDSYPKSDVFAAGFKGMPATPTTRILVMAAVPRDPKQAQ